MIPDEYREFFIASAGATGALIGLLFVAVSVFPEQARAATTGVQFQVRSSAALLVFTNALVVSLFALIPGVSLGWLAIVSGAVVLTFAIAAARSAIAERRHKQVNPGWAWLIVGLLTIAGWEIYAGIRLVYAFDLSAVQTLCYVVVGDLTFGIARAWQLVGLRDTGLVASLRVLAGRDLDVAGVDSRPAA